MLYGLKVVGIFSGFRLVLFIARFQILKDLL